MKPAEGKRKKRTEDTQYGFPLPITPGYDGCEERQHRRWFFFHVKFQHEMIKIVL